MKKREEIALKHPKDPKAFFKYWNEIIILERNKRVWIVTDDMIADMISNKKSHQLVTELFIKGRKLNIPLVFITQSYFWVPKDIRLNTRHFFIMSISNRRELQDIAISHSFDINLDEFKRLSRRYRVDRYSFFVIDTTLPSDNPLHFHKNLLEEV